MSTTTIKRGLFDMNWTSDTRRDAEALRGRVREDYDRHERDEAYVPSLRITDSEDEMINKLKALIQWFFSLELKEHRHLCPIECDCYHGSVCWFCTGLFCADKARKRCRNCEAGENRICKGTMGAGSVKCTCGQGRD